jgi:hypothetical protein
VLKTSERVYFMRYTNITRTSLEVDWAYLDSSLKSGLLFTINTKIGFIVFSSREFITSEYR